ncbi:MAG: hypothetical protein JXR30_00030 [Alphaproteobacteria bacterium]|nr:hypothetical protein [Alphaproteobacteria bacterium]
MIIRLFSFENGYLDLNDVNIFSEDAILYKSENGGKISLRNLNSKTPNTQIRLGRNACANMNSLSIKALEQKHPKRQRKGSKRSAFGLFAPLSSRL